MKDLRIAFCGASGTGKTKLAKLVAKELNLDLNPVGSREIATELGFESPYDVDAFGRRAEFQKLLLERKREWEKKNRKFITDRTHMDNLAYSIMHDCVKTVDEKFVKEATFFSTDYTHIFFFPIDVFHNLNNDPNRVSKLDYHKVYEWILLMVLEFQGIPYKFITQEKLDDRLKEVLQWVK